MTVIIFLLVLAVLIFVHELGHFLAARACGIRVDAFKLGFGPKILAWKRGETEYGVNLIPFGGFVKIHGENPDAESVLGVDRHRSFINKPRWQQVIVLAAGVFCNFLFAWLLYICVFTSGVTATTDGFEKYADRFQDQRTMITYVEPASPAEKAGIKIGDVLVGIDGGPKYISDIPGIQNRINESKGNYVILDFIHNNVAMNGVLVKPTEGLVEGKYAIGIAMQMVGDLKLPFFTAIWEGGRYTLIMIKDTATGLYDFVANIFKGSADFSQVAGPVGIAGIVGNAATLGLTYLLMITALISINLGVINLVPFPALDGGRILFVILEGTFRRPIPHKFANTVNAIGFSLLMILMVFVTYKDIVKLFVK